MYNKYPYTDFHELNLDWFLEEFKKLKEDWETTSGQWDQMQLDFQTLEGTVQTFTTFVENYFENLDVQDEINNKLDALVADGTLSTLLAPLVEENIGDAVAAQIGDTVADQIGDTVADQIDNVVADQIGDAVATPAATATTAWLTANVDPVGSAVTIDSSLTIAGSAADAKVVGDDIRDLQDIFNIVESYNKWNVTDDGKYINANGSLSPNASYQTGDYIACEPGDVWRLQFDFNGIRRDGEINPTYLTMRFIAFFDSDKNAITADYLETRGLFTVPSGAYYFRASIYTPAASSCSNYAVFKSSSSDIVAYEPYWIKKVIKENSLPVNIENEAEKLAVLTQGVNSNNTIGLSNTGTSISIDVPLIKKNVTIGFIGVFSTWSDLYIYQGKNTGWTERILKITSTDIELYKAGSLTPYYTAAHGLTLSDYISVLISEKNNGAAQIFLSSNGASFSSANTEWGGSRKDIIAEHGAESWTNILSWGSSDLSERIWIYGDSYLDHWGPIVANRGYTRYNLSGFSGAGAAAVLESFKTEIQMGSPQEVVWCVGMNNPDTGAINSTWKSAIDEIASICEDKGIHLIVQTIPNTPTNDNTYKNAYIKSEFDYIDVAELVGSNDSTSWYNGLLSNDNVHPTTAGDFYIANIMQTYLPDLRNS